MKPVTRDNESPHVGCLSAVAPLFFCGAGISVVLLLLPWGGYVFTIESLVLLAAFLVPSVLLLSGFLLRHIDNSFAHFEGRIKKLEEQVVELRAVAGPRLQGEGEDASAEE